MNRSRDFQIYGTFYDIVDRVDYERINGRYTNAEYRGKITRCDLKLNIKYRLVRGWANYFKIMQILTRN